MFRIIPEGLLYQEHVLLKNGQGLFLKPATIADKANITSFMSRISREALRMRFMASISQVSDEIINNLCNGDFTDTGCLLATEGENEDSKVVGLANYISMNNNRTAEVAFLVEDSYQGLGISTLLLERLAGLASANGIIEFEAEVLPDNQQMINVFKSSGFEIHKVWHSDTIHVEFPVDGAAALWKRTSLRERIAVANSLFPLLRPKTIAVIGAEKDPSSIGNIIFKNILSGNFTGTVYPINSNFNSVNGVKAFSSVSQLSENIDLAIISVPAEEVLNATHDSIKAGAKAIVVVSTGFAEAGKEGIKRQKELVDLVRSNGVRLLGPSCLGLMNTDDGVRLNSSLLPNLTQKGKIGFFAHSAALGLVILDYAQSLGLGFTTFVSAGNRADVSGNDLLQYWEEDPNTQIVILYLETFGNPRKFVRIARSMSYKKPILCVKSARSVAGRKTIEEKSGGMTGGVLEVEALFHQAGVILAPTLEELFDTAIVLEHQPLPEGNKVGIIANSAGMATIFADGCEANGLMLNDNGLVNLGAFANSEKYETAVYNMLIDENIQSALIGFASVGKNDSSEIAASIKKAVKAADTINGKEKPVLLCLMGAAGTISIIDDSDNSVSKKKFPAFRFPESAVRALGRIVNYAEFKKKAPGKIVWYSDVKAEKARKLIQKIISENKTLDEFIDLNLKEATEILNLFGMRITNENNIDSKLINVNIKTDSLFGPVIELNIPGQKRFVRITPLTDRDLDETFEYIKIESSIGLKQILGRLSQMIEELPWLCCLEIYVVEDENPVIISEIKMRLNIRDNKRPTY
ncbi:MAG: GNAT family N-acetyltransferase [Bacteroidetes bacterium]|nr:GNAT family N-acetyltransferase [Bacteroidota bacterium]MBU1116995.1 GNAT family N-acetyltransferase [Bacteroidota bacterium]MBU1797331.1 GNAT family N-acetyltransferase [Bacteroidota bacterium]